MLEKVVSSALQVTFILSLIFTLPVLPVTGALFGFIAFLPPVFILAVIFTPIAEYLDKKSAPTRVWIISATLISGVYFLLMIYFWG